MDPTKIVFFARFSHNRKRTANPSKSLLQFVFIIARCQKKGPPWTSCFWSSGSEFALFGCCFHAEPGEKERTCCARVDSARSDARTMAAKCSTKEKEEHRGIHGNKSKGKKSSAVRSLPMVNKHHSRKTTGRILQRSSHCRPGAQEWPGS